MNSYPDYQHEVALRHARAKLVDMLRGGPVELPEPVLTLTSRRKRGQSDIGTVVELLGALADEAHRVAIQEWTADRERRRREEGKR